jgi:ABC-2 type transport system permease protein
MRNLKKNLIALKGLVSYETHRITRIWRQTIIPPIVNISLYFLVFGHFIGSKIPLIHGYTYMSFLIPGLIMMTVIMESYNGSVFPFFMVKFHRSIEEILVAPVPSPVILLGFTLSAMVRALFVGTLVGSIAYLFNPIVPEHWGVLLLAALFASMLFALIGFFNALFSKSFEDISIVPTFILTPLVYLGGVFYSVEQLSPFWQKVSFINPITYIISIFRYGYLGIEGINYIAGLLVLVGLIIVVFSVNIILLNKGVRLKT